MATSKQRREAERRRLQRQMERRRVQAQNRKRTNLIISVVGTLVVIAAVIVLIVSTSGSDDSKKTAAGNTDASTSASTSAPTSVAPPSTAPSSTTATTKPYVPTGKCTFTKSAQAASRTVTLPASTQSTKGFVDVQVQTNRGAMTFHLNRATAPCTVGSFVSLVKQKFYDNTPCPRVESTSLFILQCGDPTGTGTGGPGYTVPDELYGTEKYTAGELAMANTGSPDSGGSQFFIIYKNDPLPASYTIFGTVTKGLDVVTKVAAGGNDGSNSAGGGKPKLPITLTKLTVEN